MTERQPSPASRYMPQVFQSPAWLNLLDEGVSLHFAKVIAIGGRDAECTSTRVVKDGTQDVIALYDLGSRS